MFDLKKIKEHFKRHKVAYCCGTTAVVTAGITWLVVRGRYATLLSRVDGPETIDT